MNLAESDLVYVAEPSILIRISKAYKSSLADDALYDYTRGRWKVNLKNAVKAKYAISVFNGVVQEVYEIFDWHPAGSTESSRNLIDNTQLNSAESLIGRYEFTGEIADDRIRNKYLHKSIKHYFVRGNSFPINYVNC